MAVHLICDGVVDVRGDLARLVLGDGVLAGDLARIVLGDGVLAGDLARLVLGDGVLLERLFSIQLTVEEDCPSFEKLYMRSHHRRN